MRCHTKKVNKNVVGRYINNSVTMAKKVYSMEADILETIKENLNITAKFGRKDWIINYITGFF